MKPLEKLFLFAAILLVFFSCKKDEKYARFEPNKYAVHYDETLNLHLVSSEEINSFRYSSNDVNVVKVSTTGKVASLYVGEATVTARYDNLSAECNVTVVPHEKLYSMLPLLSKGMSRETIKLLESAIGRDTIAAPQNVLIVKPSANDLSLETLEYTFINDGLVSVSAFLKSGTSTDKVNLFMKERYPYTEGIGYMDAHSGAEVAYYEGSNSIHYSW